MGKKEKFIDKNNSQKFHVLHRSQRDEAHANFEVPSNFVLVPAVDVSSSYQLPVLAIFNRDMHLILSCRTETTIATTTVEAVVTRRPSPSSWLPTRTTSTNSASQTMDTTTHSILETLVRCTAASIALFSSLTTVFFAFFHDAGSGGHFISKTGRAGTDLDMSVLTRSQGATVELPEDCMPSAKNLDRHYEAITINHSASLTLKYLTLYTFADQSFFLRRPHGQGHPRCVVRWL